MQLTIKFTVPGALEVPINYQHIQQGIIYRSLSGNADFAEQLHEQGYENRKRRYKAFTFGPFVGRYEMRGKRLIYRGSIQFEIRSADARMICLLEEHLRMNGMHLGEKCITPDELLLTDRTVETERIAIRMLAPMTLYRTEENGYTHYCTPEEADFARLLNDNFRRKYKAFYGIEPTEEIRFKIIDCNERNKKVVQYKQTYVGGWTGIYKLYGKRKYLDFLYQTGLGSRNSQGFGMFDVYE